MLLPVLSSCPAFLAIVPPEPEAALSDLVVSRAGSTHTAMMIALVALFVMTWLLLAEDAPTRVTAKAVRVTRNPPR